MGDETTDENRAKIREFLARYIRDADLGDDDDIFERGFVNSMFAMQLVMFVERDFGVTVGDEDLDISNFNSINSIARLVGRKRDPRPAA